MSWLDKRSIEQILLLRNQFNISTFIETGTFKGVNARFHSFNFREVLSCEINEDYFKAARSKTKHCPNVQLFLQSSPDFLRSFVDKYKKDGRDDIVFIFLDAHFYDPTLPPEEKWVIVNEIKALSGFKNCIIYVHDFCCEGLGHCCYNGESLDFGLIKDDLLKVNPDFRFYTNTMGYCSIYTEETIRGVPGIEPDEETLDNIRYARHHPSKTYRGILYCTLDELDLSVYKLKRFKEPIYV